MSGRGALIISFYRASTALFRCFSNVVHIDCVALGPGMCKGLFCRAPGRFLSSGSTDYRAISKLHVMVVGVSVHSTPVEIREKLAVAKEDWPVAIEQLVQYSHIQEAGVLSTCNRMEVRAACLFWFGSPVVTHLTTCTPRCGVRVG